MDVAPLWLQHQNTIFCSFKHGMKQFVEFKNFLCLVGPMSLRNLLYILLLKSRRHARLWRLKILCHKAKIGMERGNNMLGYNQIEISKLQLRTQGLLFHPHSQVWPFGRWAIGFKDQILHTYPKGIGLSVKILRSFVWQILDWRIVLLFCYQQL